MVLEAQPQNQYSSKLSNGLNPDMEETSILLLNLTPWKYYVMCTELKHVTWITTSYKKFLTDGNVLSAYGKNLKATSQKEHVVSLCN
jgi:hypothetical protein